MTNRRQFLRKGIAATSSLALSGSVAAACSDAPNNTNQHQPLKSMVGNLTPIDKKERTERISKTQHLMQQSNIQAIFIESGTSLDYFTGVQWGRSERMTAVIIPNEGELVYICPAFEEKRLQEKITITGEVRVWQEHESPYQLVVDSLKDKKILSGNIGIEENVRFFMANGLAKLSSNYTYVDAKPVVGACRRIKSPTELALMKKANEITLEAYKIGFSRMEKGMSQYDLNALIYNTFTELGATGSGWVGASFGEFAAFPHGSSQPQALQEGDIVLIDGGCKLYGYQADITRTTVFGEPTKRQKQVWEVVKNAQSAVYEHIAVGKPCELLDAVARSVIEKAGFGSGYTNFFHRVGHGIGMDFHEWEYLVKGNKTPLTPGMCFSNEPGIYLYGEFGVRLEDCFYVTENGYEAFTPQSPAIDLPV